MTSLAPATTSRRLLGPALCLAVLTFAAAPAHALLPDLPVPLSQEASTPAGGVQADVAGTAAGACADVQPAGALSVLPALPATPSLPAVPAVPAPALPGVPSAAADACLDADLASPAVGGCASVAAGPTATEACASAGTGHVEAKARTGPVEAAFQGAVGAFSGLLDALGGLF